MNVYMIRQKETQLYWNLEEYSRCNEPLWHTSGNIYKTKSQVPSVFSYHTFEEEEYELVEFQLVENKFI